jgi:hypothetical protein
VVRVDGVTHLYFYLSSMGDMDDSSVGYLNECHIRFEVFDEVLDAVGHVGSAAAVDEPIVDRGDYFMVGTLGICRVIE